MSCIMGAGSGSSQEGEWESSRRRQGRGSASARARRAVQCPPGRTARSMPLLRRERKADARERGERRVVSAHAGGLGGVGVRGRRELAVVVGVDESMCVSALVVLAKLPEPFERESAKLAGVMMRTRKLAVDDKLARGWNGRGQAHCAQGDRLVGTVTRASAPAIVHLLLLQASSRRRCDYETTCRGRHYDRNQTYS